MRDLGLQAELALSLSLVMLAATLTLGTVLYQFNEHRLRDVLGSALRIEARAQRRGEGSVVAGTRWWRVLQSGEALRIAGPLEAQPGAIDPESLALALRARATDLPLLLPGAPWSEIRFAMPLGMGGDVAVARLPHEASLRMRATPLILTGLFLLLDVVIFTVFGALQVRRRVVLPVQRLADASRELGEGSFGRRLEEEGPREIRDVTRSFNEMDAALEARTADLEKAVGDLRVSNRALREARDGLGRAERMAAVGRLAAGVAHEVGNPMGAMLAYLSLAERDTGSSADTKSHLGRAADQGERIRRILKQLLDYSKPPRPERIALDFAELARESVELANTQSRNRKLRFEVEVIGEVPLARGDPGMVAQVLLNLVMNAAAAVGENDGVIQLRLCGAAAAARPGESAGEVARLRRSHSVPDAVECLVLDNGPGVAEEDRERIFDPFFTTKAPGEGTGLGLANARSLAEELGGCLELADAPAPFACALRFVLPAHCEDDCGVRTGIRS